MNVSSCPVSDTFWLNIRLSLCSAPRVNHVHDAWGLTETHSEECGAHRWLQGMMGNEGQVCLHHLSAESSTVMWSLLLPAESEPLLRALIWGVVSGFLDTTHDGNKKNPNVFSGAVRAVHTVSVLWTSGCCCRVTCPQLTVVITWTSVFLRDKWAQDRKVNLPCLRLNQASNQWVRNDHHCRVLTSFCLLMIRLGPWRQKRGDQQTELKHSDHNKLGLIS